MPPTILPLCLFTLAPSHPCAPTLAPSNPFAPLSSCPCTLPPFVPSCHHPFITLYLHALHDLTLHPLYPVFVTFASFVPNLCTIHILPLYPVFGAFVPSLCMLSVQSLCLLHPAFDHWVRVQRQSKLSFCVPTTTGSGHEGVQRE